MRRFLIWIPVYGFIVVVLPRNPAFETLTEPLQRIHPDVRTIIAVVALVVSLTALYALQRTPPLFPRLERSWAKTLVFAGVLGVAFSGAIDLLDVLSGGVPNLIYLILVPVGFMLAEAVVMLIEHRLNRGPIGSEPEERGFEVHMMDDELSRVLAGEGTSYLSQQRAIELLEAAESQGMVIRDVEVWRVDGELAHRIDEHAIHKRDTRRMAEPAVHDFIRGRLGRLASGPDTYVFILRM
ncbi:MAG: hypothetical protein AAFY85_06755, partial [Pseudomonadota bacterium]